MKYTAIRSKAGNRNAVAAIRTRLLFVLAKLLVDIFFVAICPPLSKNLINTRHKVFPHIMLAVLKLQAQCEVRLVAFQSFIAAQL